MLSLLQYISFYFNINFAAFVGFQIAVYAYVVLRILHTQLTSPSSPSLKCLAGVLLYLFYKLCHILIINSILYKAICMPHCYFFSLFDKKLNWTELSELPGKTELRSLTYEHRTKFYLNAECLPGLLWMFSFSSETTGMSSQRSANQASNQNAGFFILFKWIIRRRWL